MLTGDDFRRGANLEARCDTILNIGIAGFADRGNPAITDADIRLHDSPVVHDNHVRDDEVRRGTRRGACVRPCVHNGA